MTSYSTRALAARQPASYPSAEEPSTIDRVRVVAELPQALQPAFAGMFRYFNPVQSEAFSLAFSSDSNLVVAAPTGSGKTGVMELAILRLVARQIDRQGQLRVRRGAFKAVYLAPTRALVQERVRDWQERLGSRLGLSVSELTGDTDTADLAALADTDIICSTPEKFDAVTRKHKNQGGMRFFGEISLVCIDEVHLLNEARGSTLEAGVVSRIKMVSRFREMQELPIASVRFVAVSATIPNVHDIAQWLHVPANGLLVFGEEMRPVKLVTHVRGYAQTGNDFMFERRLNDYLPGIVAEFSKGKPTLIFCSSRKGTVDTAQRMLGDSARAGQSGRFDRALVEACFLDRSILVLCTTSTLALGVNLPAHLVVLKGTRRYSSGAGEAAGYVEYDKSTCLQMVGRAGRPQFDTEGVAVIMTTKNLVQRYRNLLTGEELLESALRAEFAEYLNAEIVLRTVVDVFSAVAWLRSTYLYIRMKRNPAAYGMPVNLPSEAAFDEAAERRPVQSTLTQLAQHGLIGLEQCGTITARVPGQLMAHYYIKLRTMIGLITAPTHASLPDLIMLLARSQEFANVILRRGEKKALNAMNHALERVRFFVPSATRPQKPKERIQTAAEKIFILVNEALSDKPSDTLDFSMRQEVDRILKIGARIAVCMSKLYTHKRLLAATSNALLLQKCLKQRLWDNTRFECRQVPGIGKLLSERLHAAGLSPLRQLAAADPRRIEATTQRHFPFGNQVVQQLCRMMPPPIELKLTLLGQRPGGLVEVEVTLTRTTLQLTSDAADAPGGGGGGARSDAQLIAGTLHDDQLLVHEVLVLEQFPSPLMLRIQAALPPPGQASLSVVATVAPASCQRRSSRPIGTEGRKAAPKRSRATLLWESSASRPANSWSHQRLARQRHAGRF
ncbi:hypothetical protein WJX81_006765 [Elliptochloris bilobata]|uniref:DNA 3'-5' helicase n=1 Tax=Elliptochloris bilobata TaxID=381761 RepID=A0AAW1RF34_9CHLO